MNGIAHLAALRAKATALTCVSLIAKVNEIFFQELLSKVCRLLYRRVVFVAILDI